MPEVKSWRITSLLLLLLFGVDALAITCAPKTAVPGFFGVSVSRARYYNPQVGRFWTMDTFEGSQTDPLSLHKYLYCHADPINGTDPSGHEYSLTSQLGVLQNLGTVIRFTTSVLRTAYKAKTALEFMQDMMELGNFLLSGEFTALVRSRIQDSIDVTKTIDVDEAIESLLRHTDTLIIVTDFFAVVLFTKLAS